MKWYNFLACLFLGVFLANSIPHFIQGVCGNRFPTPFANPPGRGLSSPTINIAWALINMIIAFLLYKASKITTGDRWAVFLFIIGFAAMSIRLSIALSLKAMN